MAATRTKKTDKHAEAGAVATDLAGILQDLRGRDPENKVFALMALGLIGSPDHAGAVIDLLGSSDESVVVHAIDCLGRLGDPSALPYLIDFVDHDNTRYVNKALEVLPRFQVKTVLDRLLAIAGISSRPEVQRRSLVTVLAGVADPKVENFMAGLLAAGTGPEVMAAAALYFVRFPMVSRREALLAQAENAHWEVALNVNLALTRSGDEAAMARLSRMVRSPSLAVRQALIRGVLINPKAGDRTLVEALLVDPNARVRETALSALSLFSPGERVNWLKGRWPNESEEAVRLQLLRFVAKEKDPALVALLVAALGDSHETVKSAVRQSLVTMGTTMVPTLMALFDRQPLAVREQLALILGDIGDRRAVDLLWRCVRSTDRWLRLHAVQALAALQHRDSLAKLLELLSNEADLWMRATLLIAVARLGGPDLEATIAAHLTHQDARVRANAVEALGLLGSPGALDKIKPVFRDPNDRVRVNAALTLYKLGDSTVLSTLRGMCAERNKWIKSSAAFALGEIGDAEATPELLVLLRDREEVVYRNALEALVKIGDIRALVPLLKEKGKGRLPEASVERMLPTFSERLRQNLRGIKE